MYSRRSRCPLSALALGAILYNSAPARPVDRAPNDAVALEREVPVGPVEPNASPSTTAADPNAPSDPGNPRDPVAVPERRRALAAEPADETPVGFLRGQVVDALNGDPVPDFALELSAGSGPPERVVSGNDGQFETKREYAAGEFEYDVIDRDGVSLHWRIRAWDVDTYREPAHGKLSFQPGEAKSIAVEVGPTYEVYLVGAADAASSAFTAWLRGPDAYNGTVGPTSFTTDAPLRGGGERWVRFQPAEDRLSITDGPWSLQLESADGLWYGSAQVEPGNGVHASVVEIELHSGARLDVDLSGADGLPLENPVVELVATDREWSLAFTSLGSDDRAPRFGIGPVQPGPYTLKARADNGLPYNVELELREGDEQVHSIVLESRSIHETIRGTLTSDSGDYRDNVTLQLVEIDGRVSRSWLSKWEELDGRWVAPFVFENLPPARFLLRIHPWLDQHVWDGASFEIDAPADDLVFTCLDREKLRDFAIHVDVAPGCVAPDYVEFFHSLRESPTQRLRKRFGSVFKLEGIPQDAELEWCVRAEGFAPVWGDTSDFVVVQGIAEARVELHSGWGARIRVVTSDGDEQSPLPGAQIHADGSLLGQTDALGRLDLRLDAEPGDLAARHATLGQFAIRGGDFDLATGKLDGTVLVHSLEVAVLPADSARTVRGPLSTR